MIIIASYGVLILIQMNQTYIGLGLSQWEQKILHYSPSFFRGLENSLYNPRHGHVQDFTILVMGNFEQILNENTSEKIKVSNANTEQIDVKDLKILDIIHSLENPRLRLGFSKLFIISRILISFPPLVQYCIIPSNSHHTSSPRPIGSNQSRKIGILDHLRKHLYVDDLMLSVDTIKEAILVRREIMDILVGMKMKIRKRASNSCNILDTIPPEDRHQTLSDSNNMISKDTKRLGVSW